MLPPDSPPVRGEHEDGSRFYPYPPTGEQLDSVTAIIDGTDHKPWLGDWVGRTRMAWAVDNLETVARVKVLKGRDEAVKLGKDEAEQVRAVAADAGSYVHKVLEALIIWAGWPDRSGARVPVPDLPDHLRNAMYHTGGGHYEPLTEVVDSMVTGFTNWVSDFAPQFEAAEMTVYNQPLGYAGTLDMIIILYGYAILNGRIIASPGSVLVLCVDTKTGRKCSGTWADQIAPYRRAAECLLPLGDLRPMPPTDAGAVLHLRPEHPGGYLFYLVAGEKDQAGWERFLARVKVYREGRALKDGRPGPVIRPLRPDGTLPGPRLCDIADEGWNRAVAPLRRALGAGLELSDLARFTKTDVLTIRGVGKKLIGDISQMLAGHGLALASEPPAGKAA
jgi:hypothetical protein